MTASNDPAKNESLLTEISSPAELRTREVDELPDVVAAVRDHLVRTISRTGGHLAAGLGTVELAVALHYVFDTPEDRLVWDVGHQALSLIHI